ncbi:restriction endonuclease fold toxin 5 domain-containing protein [Burkholderia gladioli]|nr:restriction endonuclease fold toxin 5 domain-containing protein [Burkholderia gladioli]MBU9426420.1 restriction endonuclease fold toxin 5 domain-containing protein [Burkholderia gladioli]MDN8063498.1 restriction endonuclease fold toxin 5 domain-containing protein [Burkholderia gladioli]
MAGFLVPAIEGAVVELGPVLARAGTALLGGAAVAGTASLSGDTKQDASKATPAVRAVPRTGESCKKCPPEAGGMQRRNWSMSDNSREYQGRITGLPYSIAERWSMEWVWERDFDGFRPEECLLLEAKAKYDQFLNKQDVPYTGAFDDMEEQAFGQAAVVNANPPARLKWYFQTERTWSYMRAPLVRLKIESEWLP